MARKRYHIGRTIFKYNEQVAIWANDKHLTLGFTGPITGKTFDLVLFKRQLAETVAWCAPRVVNLAPQSIETALWSVVPEPPDTYYYLHDSEGKKIFENSIAGMLRRQRGYEAFFQARSERLIAENIPIVEIPPDLAGGRLLVFDINNVLYEGAMLPESWGFFGAKDEPAWDTWVYYNPIEELLICWVPSEMIGYAEDGLSVMSIEWCWWITGDEPYNFVRDLKAAGYV